MKKFMLGVIVGVTLTVAGSAYADDIVESVIGKTVQGVFPVKVDGKQLSDEAAVIDGTSYLPVRAIGEALNKEVSFSADLGIELKSKEATTVSDDSQTTVTPTTNTEIQVIQKRYNEITKDLEKLLPQKSDIIGKINAIDIGISKDQNKAELQKQLDDLQTQLDALIAEKKELEVQLMPQ